MSYTREDAAWDEFWDQMSKELYPEHKEQAIDEFTNERLQSFYVKNPEILIPGIKRFQEAGELLEKHPSASFVFSTTAIEIFLKASLLKPVVYGLVHNEALAEIVVESALGGTGFDRYKGFMSKLLKELADIDIRALKRSESEHLLIDEVSKVQKIRNGVIHRGDDVSIEKAEFARSVATAVLSDVVGKMLQSLGLNINSHGQVEVA